jgi:putative transposase
MSRCRAGPVDLQRHTASTQSRPRNDDVPVARIREIALRRVRYGYWRICMLLRQEGWRVNQKRVYRLYRLEV